MSKRNKELILLIPYLVILFLGFGLASLSSAKNLSLDVFKPAIILAVLFLVAHLALRLLAKEADPFLLPVVAFLTSLGVVMVGRLRPELAFVQVLWALIGTLALVTVLFLFKNYNELENYKYILALLGLALLLSPIFFGREIGGSKLWLNFGTFSFQPSEIAKILLVIFLASYLKEKRELLSTATHKLLGVWVPDFKYFGPLLVMWAISLLVLIFEKDLGSSLLFFGMFLGLLYVATERESYVIIGALLFLTGAVACYLVFTHVQTRIDIWLNPWKDVSGSGYQIAQSLFAIASGSLSGSGLGRGLVSLVHFPAIHTDFIFAALAEELGLFGGVAIILSYLVIAYRGFKIALETDDEFGKLLVAGLTFVLVLQAFVILGGVTKLIPLTGVTLPLVSYGGSSILSNFILVGLILAVSSRRARLSSPAASANGGQAKKESLIE